MGMVVDTTLYITIQRSKTYSEREDDEEWLSSAALRSMEVLAGMLLLGMGKLRGGA